MVPVPTVGTYEVKILGFPTKALNMIENVYAVPVAVLWIRIRLDPKLFSGSGFVIINFGSGSYELQFLVTKIALNLLRPQPNGYRYLKFYCKEQKIHR